MPICINYEAGASAQLKSAVMLAGLNAYGNTTINEIQTSRDHTENILSSCSGVIKVSNKSKKTITILGKKILKPTEINVPNDPSSAAFFTALTLLNGNSSLTIKNVGLNPTRTGFYQLLIKQGAKIKFKKKKKNNNEVKGDIIVKSCNLKPIKAEKSIF